MSFGGELEYAAVPPASEEPRRGVNRLTAETGCFGNGVSASTLDRCRGEFQKLRHLRHLLEQSCTTRRRARAARVAGACDAVGVRGGTFRLRFLAVGSCIGSSVVGSVCVFLSARLRRRVAPLCSYRCLFVGLVVARAWCVINRQRRESIALLFLLVLSLTAWLSPRHPVQRRPAIVLVPFGTSPDHGALIFLFVKERAADCARYSPGRGTFFS